MPFQPEAAQVAISTAFDHAGLAKVATLKRVNVGKAGPDALADALKKIVISKGPQAMFWGKDGACVTG